MLNIQSIPSPNHFNGRDGYTPRWIILHGTAGFETAEQCAVFFSTTQSQVSAHYVVGRDGSIIACVQESDAAWSNGVLSAGHDPWWSPDINPNFLTIAIEHVKPHTDNTDQLTGAQAAASFQLVKDICQRWHIPMRKADAQGGITGHYSIDPVNRSRCPGPYPWADLFAFLKEQTMSGVPTGWKDNDGTTLTAPNGHKVIQGFRSYILAHNWDPANVPLEEEHGIEPPESGTEQVFAQCALRWTPATGVYVEDIGDELLTLRKNTTQPSPTQDKIAAAVSTLHALSTAVQTGIANVIGDLGAS
jgi:N-acetyl-anhydromuramyl-L-alanine amidase AmpD